MNIKVKNGTTEVKLEAAERRALEKARDVLAQLDNHASDKEAAQAAALVKACLDRYPK